MNQKLDLSENDMEDLVLESAFAFGTWLLDPSRSIYELTFGAEILGNHEDTNTMSVLEQLLTHESPIVREGVVYGLAAVSNSESQVVLRNLLETETNQTVHEAAECALHFD